MTEQRGRKKAGILVVSLDFELYWGMADITDVEVMSPIMKNVHKVVPRLLDLFKKYNLHVTWATVGALMAEDREDFLNYLPNATSKQTYTMIEKMGIVPENSNRCPHDILFAPELVRMVANTPGQEIGTHTYSHYYCNESDSTPEDFASEINSAICMACAKGYEIKSAVFPRNQVSDEFLEVMDKVQPLAFRGNENGWISAIKSKHLRLWTLFWYIDNYIPLQRRQSYKINDILDRGRLNIRNSRFFKPFRPKFRFAEKLKLHRYKREMLKAAKKCEIYHMYWHPHNFAVDTEINFAQMEELLNFYSELNKKYGMESLNMNEVAERYSDTIVFDRFEEK